MSVEIRRGTATFQEREVGRLTRHHLAFGDHYDAGDLRFGPMVCHDDHLLARGRGFETHRHSGLVVVSHVVSGALEHGPDDVVGVPAGSTAVFRPGAGARHSEIAAEPQTRFVQVWLADPDPPAEPTYEVLDHRDGGSVEPLPGARLDVVVAPAGVPVTLPAAPFVHAFVARGALLRSSLAEPLADGDAFRFTDEPGYDVVPGVDSLLLVWSFASA